jgi:diguanylate cyclase (GGDEF)-like protein
MISIKKHIDDCERSIVRSALDAWCSALVCVGRNTERAIPGIKGSLKDTLKELSERVKQDATPAMIEDSQNCFESELGRWADSVIADLQNKTLEVKEMLLTLAAAAEGITQRDSRNSTRFGELTQRLHSIGRLEDIRAIRQQLTASALDMKANVQRMEEEGRATVRHLQTQIAVYRASAAESERCASTDQLTGLKNRRGVELAIESRRERQSVFSVILLDLNGFKRINDEHGHVVGDEVLKQFSGELRGLFRSADVVGRWGGDEFIVITDSDSREIESCMNRVRRWVLGKYRVKTPRGTLEIELDASIGLAVWDLQENSERLLVRADTLMYAEKRLRT